MNAKNRERAVLEWLDGQHDAMVDLLRRLVNIDSGSYNKAGTDQVFGVLSEHLEGFGVSYELIPLATSGHDLRALVPAGTEGAGNRPIMLMGHCDTVFADGTASERPFKIVDGRAYGPGVNDMKSGIVLNTFVLSAIAKTGGAQVTLDVGTLVNLLHVTLVGAPVIAARLSKGGDVTPDETGFFHDRE